MPIARLALLARLFIVALVALVILDPPAALAQDQKQPTATGSGGAAASVDIDGTRAAIQALRDGGNAVDAAVAAASMLGVTEPFSCGIGGGGFMVIRTPVARSRRSTDARSRRPRCGPTRPGRTARRYRSTTPASAASRPAPRHARHLADGAPALRHAGRSATRSSPASGSRATASRSTRPSSTRRRPNVDWFNDIPSTAAIYLDPDGTPRDVGSTLKNPDLARTYQRIADRGADRLLRRPGGAARSSSTAAASADGGHRQPRLAARPHDPRRPGRYRASSARRPASATAASTCTAWARPPAAARPSARRSTSSRATTSRPTACARSTCSSRLRGSPSPTATPTSPTRTSSTSRSTGLLSDGFAAERRALIDEHARRRARSRPATPTTTRAATRSRRTRAPPEPRAPVDHPPHGSPTARATSSPTPSRSSRPAATRSSCRASGSCSNNELTDFNFDSADATRTAPTATSARAAR